MSARRGIRILIDRDLSGLDLDLSTDTSIVRDLDRNIVLAVYSQNIISVQDLELEFIARRSRDIRDDLNVVVTGVHHSGSRRRVAMRRSQPCRSKEQKSQRSANLGAVHHKFHVLDVRDIRGTNNVEVKVLQLILGCSGR